MPEFIVVFCTCGSEAEAEEIAAQLVSEQLAACVQINAPIRSVYRWQGKVESAQEWLLSAKSTREAFDAIREAILELHSYEVPEIVALPIVAGSAPYLAWIREGVHA